MELTLERVSDAVDDAYRALNEARRQVREGVEFIATERTANLLPREKGNASK